MGKLRKMMFEKLWARNNCYELGKDYLFQDWFSHIHVKETRSGAFSTFTPLSLQNFPKLYTVYISSLILNPLINTALILYTAKISFVKHDFKDN